MKCSKGVFGAGQACQAMGNLYHDACFTCAACSKSVRGRGEGVRIVGTEKGRRGKSVHPGDTWPSALHVPTERQDSVIQSRVLYPQHRVHRGKVTDH